MLCTGRKGGPPYCRRTRMYDVIRGAHRVCVILPESSPQRKAEWESRMWTLPEALLVAQHSLKVCAPDGTSQTLSLLDMSDACVMMAI